MPKFNVPEKGLARQFVSLRKDCSKHLRFLRKIGPEIPDEV